MTKIVGSAPILLVSDVEKSADYFVRKIGFTNPQYWGEPPTFCIVRRDSFHLMLGKVDAPHVVCPNWKLREKTCDAYFWVDDAKTLYEDLKDRGAIIDYELYEAPWGCLEFGIQDLDGHDIAFGQDLNGYPSK